MSLTQLSKRVISLNPNLYHACVRFETIRTTYIAQQLSPSCRRANNFHRRQHGRPRRLFGREQYIAIHIRPHHLSFDAIRPHRPTPNPTLLSPSPKPLVQPQRVGILRHLGNVLVGNV